MNYEEICNIRIIGDSTVGKTSILNRFTNDFFSTNYASTVGVDYFFKDEIINDRRIRIKIWDTVGQERYRSLTTSFFRNAQGIILTFDVTNKNTFDSLKFWIESLQNSLGSLNVIQILIIGNKIDMKYKREVTFEEADKFCIELNLPYFECSAKDNININKSISFIVQKIFQQISFDDIQCRDSFNINTGLKKKDDQNKKCCGV